MEAIPKVYGFLGVLRDKDEGLGFGFTVVRFKAKCLGFGLWIYGF